MISRVMDRESWALIVFQNEVTASSRQFFSHIESLLNLSFIRGYCCYYAVYGEILINEDLFDLWQIKYKILYIHSTSSLGR